MSARKVPKDWRKELEKRKRKRLEGVTREAARRMPGASKTVIEPPGHEKMSEVLHEFVRPFLFAPGDIGTEENRKVISLAVVAWNMALFPEDRQAEEVDRALEMLLPRSSRGRGELRPMLVAMIERKRADFADNRRIIISYEVTEQARGFHLAVASTLV